MIAGSDVPRRVRPAVGAALAGLLLLAGCAPTGGGEVAGANPASSGAPIETAAPASTGVGAAGGFQDPDLESNAPRAGELVPTHVSIPAIGVESDLETLALAADGRIQPPVDWQRAGWYAGGVVPGDVGPAVVAGHVDSPGGPAVFLELAQLAPGDAVTVTLSDGSVATFVVDRSLRAAKADFPTSEVYAPTPTPQLRLITCDGDWDPATGHYTDNLVVFATSSVSTEQSPTTEPPPGGTP